MHYSGVNGILADVSTRLALSTPECHAGISWHCAIVSVADYFYVFLAFALESVRQANEHA